MRLAIVDFFAKSIAALACCVGLSTAFSEENLESTRSAADLVNQALQHEADGESSQREQLLQEALQRSPESAPARWHTGHVMLRDEWLTHEEVAKRAANNMSLVNYRRVRPTYAETIDDQLALAAWCAQQELPDQQRVHLTKVLSWNSNHLEARRLLGYRQENGTWMTDEEIRDADEKTARAARNLQEWGPRLLAERGTLISGNSVQRRKAIERLLAVKDSAALPAIERVLSPFSQETAMLAAQIMAGISGHEASAALARQAVLSASARVRVAAAEELRSRPFETFVPGLLSVMVSPIQSRMALLQDGSGRILYRHVFYRELQDERQLAVFDTDYGLQSRVQSGVPGGTTRGVFNRVPNQFSQLMSRANFHTAANGGRTQKAIAAAKAQARETAVARQNAMTSAFNNRVCAALASATGQYLPAAPQSWWQWWNDYNEVYVNVKPFSKRYERGQQTNSIRQVAIAPSPPRSKRDCLAAGTLVWTEAGSVAIELIRAGDRVLSQDVESGELAYKPVLRTTIRPAAKLVRITVGEQPVLCTGGHVFWVSGAGWVKAREIKSGNRLHCVNGTTTPQSVDLTEAQRTYNLVVADFHTYFVGDNQIFTHDNTVRSPTNVVVPGLIESKN